MKISGVKKVLSVATLQVVLLAAAVAAGPSQAQNVTAPPPGAAVTVEVARKQLKDNMDVQIAEFLKLHNDARAEVGVPPLVWDDKLAAYAQEWADHLAAQGAGIKHRTDLKVGENLSSYSDTSLRAVHGAKMWYDEIKDYDPIKNESKNGNAVGHYTQMVWRNTTKVGFGIAMAADGNIILCANYDPAGNFTGQHPYNK
jgi:pathogenesis-related protein 1